ncbi:MAG: hemin uptake protein HemP [Sulfurimonas sp.]|nr:hemin uptake protein HemP [Sulfurimonas sp.]
MSKNNKCKEESMKEKVQIDSKKLFAATKVVEIVHDTQVYILRITRDNKLILTK